MSIIDLNTTIHDLKALKQMQDELAAEITTLEDRIKQHMTENDIDIINTADCRVTWKEVSSARLDTAAIRRELPELAERYTRISTVRRFCIN